MSVKGFQTMDAKNVLLDKAKAVCLTDSAIAARLKVTRQMVSHWRKDRFPLPQAHVVTLAKIAHEDPAKWLVLIEAQQSKGTIQREWLKAAERLGIAASLIVLLGSFALPAGAFRANQATLTTGGLCIMRTLQWLIAKVRKTFTWSRPVWHAGRSAKHAPSPLLA